jgi:hypothetical protein
MVHFVRWASLPLPLPPGDFFSFFRLSAVAGPVCGSLSVSGLPCIWKDGDPRDLHLVFLCALTSGGL